MESNEDTGSGSARDKMKKLEEQIKKLTTQLKATTEKRVRLAKVSEEEPKAETTKSSGVGLVYSVCNRKKDTPSRIVGGT